MGSLEGKAVIITGAGAGLGRAYALAVAEAGAAVVVNDVSDEAAVSTVDEVTRNGGRAVAVVGSVADWDVARSLTQACTAHFGRVDGLVNNAGIARHSKSWEEREEDLRAIAEVNILGSQFAARHALEAMIDQGTGGVVINVISGARLGIDGMSAYGASKGAVAAMTLNWALEARAHGIRVNAISPLGLTQMARLDTRGVMASLPEPELIAPLVVALLNEKLSDLTGALLRFDGTQLSFYRDSLEVLASSDEGWQASSLVALLAESTVD